MRSSLKSKSSKKIHNIFNMYQFHFFMCPIYPNMDPLVGRYVNVFLTCTTSFLTFHFLRCCIFYMCLIWPLSLLHVPHFDFITFTCAQFDPYHFYLCQTVLVPLLHVPHFLNVQLCYFYLCPNYPNLCLCHFYICRPYI